jgi:hypothetical protein
MDKNEKRKYERLIEFDRKHGRGESTGIERKLYQQGIDVLSWSREQLQEHFSKRAWDEKTIDLLLDYTTAGYQALEKHNPMYPLSDSWHKGSSAGYVHFYEGGKTSCHLLNMRQALEAVYQRRKILGAMMKDSTLKPIILANKEKVKHALSEYRKVNEYLEPERVTMRNKAEAAAKEQTRLYNMKEDRNDTSYCGG